MNGRRPAPDGSGSVPSRVRDWVDSVDRGWKATAVGVAITLLYAAGVV